MNTWLVSMHRIENNLEGEPKNREGTSALRTMEPGELQFSNADISKWRSIRVIEMPTRESTTGALQHRCSTTFYFTLFFILPNFPVAPHIFAFIYSRDRFAHFRCTKRKSCCLPSDAPHFVSRAISHSRDILLFPQRLESSRYVSILYFI